MASSPTLSTTGEEDEEISDSGEGNFQRAYRKDGKISSSKGQQKEKDGLYYRLSGKVSQRNLELQAENTQLREELSMCKAKLRSEEQKRLNQQRQLHAILHDCNNVQLGDGNTITIIPVDPKIEDPVPLIKEILRKTSDANDEILQKLSLSENNLKNAQEYLKKIHYVVTQLRDSSSPSKQSELKERLEEMTEIPHETTVNDVYNVLQKTFESMEIDDRRKHFDDLTKDGKRAIRIFVYKFGSVTQEAFANMLGGLGSERKRLHGDELLDEQSCALIMLHWLKKKPENSIGKLIGILKSVESQLIQRSMQDIKEQTFVKSQHVPFEPEVAWSEPVLLSKSKVNRLYGSMSTLSQTSNLSVISETFEKLERHADTRLQNPDIKPDENAILCAMYKLHMDNTRTLRAIEERLLETGERFV